MYLVPVILSPSIEEALALELAERRIPFERQWRVDVEYKGQRIDESRLDVLVGGCLIVELEAVESLMPIHRARVISYLKMTGLVLGLLINFNTTVLKQGTQRVILTK